MLVHGRPVCFDSCDKHATTITINSAEAPSPTTLDRTDLYPQRFRLRSPAGESWQMLLVAMSAVLAVVVFFCISSFLVSPLHKDTKRQPSKPEGRLRAGE